LHGAKRFILQPGGCLTTFREVWDIMDSHGRLIGRIKGSLSSSLGWLIGHSLGFGLSLVKVKFRIEDVEGNRIGEVEKLLRPLSVLNIVHPTYRIHDAEGKVIGTVKRRSWAWKPTYEVKDANDKMVAVAYGTDVKSGYSLIGGDVIHRTRDIVSILAHGDKLAEVSRRRESSTWKELFALLSGSRVQYLIEIKADKLNPLLVLGIDTAIRESELMVAAATKKSLADKT